jgi:hypothetical protein
LERLRYTSTQIAATVAIVAMFRTAYMRTSSRDIGFRCSDPQGRSKV